MNIVKLQDLMETRYIINSLSKRFINCLEDCIRKNATLDFSGCKVGPRCHSIMRDYYAKVDMCNSANEEEDSILKHNCRVARTVVESYSNILTLERDITVDKTLEMITTLPMNECYTVNINLSDMTNKAAIVMLIMARPDISWDIRQCASDIYDFVRDTWVTNSMPHERYYELLTPNIVLREPREDGRYGDVDYGYMTQYDFVRQRKVLPYEFGNSQIIKLDGSGVSDEWYNTVDKCFNIFKSNIKKERTPGRTIKNFLRFRGDDRDD